MTDINLSEILGISTSEINVFSPTTPDSSSFLVLTPSATTGTEAASIINFETASNALIGGLASSTDNNTMSLFAAPGNDLQLYGDSVTIQGLVYPSTDGTSTQVLATTGTGTLYWTDVVTEENYIVLTAPGQLQTGKKYYLNSSSIFVMPDSSVSTIGDAIQVSKSAGSIPTITSFDAATTATQLIVTDIGSDTAITYDTMQSILFVFNGISWNLEFGGQ